MNRTQWKIFAVGMCGLFPSLGYALPHAAHNPWLMALPAFFMVLLIGGTIGWMTVRFIRDLWNRAHGAETVGRVIHARGVGQTNYVDTWEVDAELPDGTMTNLLVVRNRPFFPGEPIQLIVNPSDPKHAVIPNRRSYDF